MRYRLAVLMLFMLLAMLPVMYLPAAPAPEPANAILDIGAPPKWMAADEYCKDVIYRLTDPDCFLWHVGVDTEVSKLPSIAPLKKASPWLANHIRVTKEKGGSRLRLTFRAGKRGEQIAILNSLLRYYLRYSVEDNIRIGEKQLRWQENCADELERRINSGQHRESVDSYRKGINDLRSKDIPSLRAELARLKQVSVIKWAK
jgi:hypothetical protein